MTEQPDDTPRKTATPARPARPAPRRRKRFLRLFSLCLILLLAVGGYVAWDAWSFLQAAPETPGKEIIVDIEPGSSLGTTAAMLQQQGVITDAFRFRLLARVMGKEQKVQAGRFLVHTGWAPQKVLDYLVSGQGKLDKVTVPEGLAWWEVGAILEQAGMCKAADFDKVIHDPEFLRRYGIPFRSAEGFLYPETYLLPQPRQMDEKAARSVAGRMIDTFWKRADVLWPDGRPDVKTLRETVILASIVEKETAVPAERARVAGVYANRLKKGMLLQADPTTIYGLGPEFKGQLLRRHLEDQNNPYNTYKLAGLPPGPICSPGGASLKAALTPEQHGYYYFVATGRDGSHVFSATLGAHNNAVRDYRNAVREQQQPSE